ncbi:hypothetical protein ABWL48_20465, partial [Streptococcus suis]
RITLLIDLLKPIVNKLISERANIGSVVRKEVDEIRRKEKKLLRKKEYKKKKRKRLQKKNVGRQNLLVRRLSE